MKFKVGDKVSVIDEAIDGLVISTTNNEITVLSDDGFSLVFFENELIKIHDTTIKVSNADVFSALQIKETKKKNPKTRIKTKERQAPPLEVDLHIEKLTSTITGLSNFDMLNLQMDTVKRQLDFAIAKKIQRVVFIHGVGQGVLKAELDFLLKRYENLKYYEANYQKYGQGATEVYFFQNKT